MSSIYLYCFQQQKLLFHELIPYGLHPENGMESIWKLYGMSVESMYHSMESIWNNLGRVKYWDH